MSSKGLEVRTRVPELPDGWKWYIEPRNHYRIVVKVIRPKRFLGFLWKYYAVASGFLPGSDVALESRDDLRKYLVRCYDYLDETNQFPFERNRSWLKSVLGTHTSEDLNSDLNDTVKR